MDWQRKQLKVKITLLELTFVMLIPETRAKGGDNGPHKTANTY